MDPKQVADFLIAKRMLQPSQVDDILQEANLNGRSLERVLIDGQFVDESSLYQVIADALGTEFVDLSDIQIPSMVLQTIPSGLARLHRVLPVCLVDNTLHVAFSDPTDLRAGEDLRFALGRDLHVVVAPSQQVEEQINLHYGSETPSLSEVHAQLTRAARQISFDSTKITTADIEAEANATPVIQFVDLILLQAVRSHASDIHFEPFEADFRIRYRVDGTLSEISPPPAHLALPVISRIKVMANLDIAERRLPQDGRIRKEIAGRFVDMRVSTLPTRFGESVVLRVLDRSAVDLDFESLGLPPLIHQAVLEIIERPNGMFIVTGPTGSGKTTTLYSCLKKVNTIDSKLLTAEEPIEYDLDGVVQIPVHDAIGLSFARALRAFLRQDPDRIMVGEIRDLETAQISIQAALTGHMVFTTLHTNDAAGTIARLIDMGVEPFLISSTVEAVLAQRLIRTICSHCRTTCRPSEALLEQLGSSATVAERKDFFAGKGCNRCKQTGYKGRKGIFELMRVTDSLRENINDRAPAVALKEQAIEQGMVTLRQNALRCVFAGETTVDEVLRYT